jgi:hypothetical protein
MLFDAAAIVTGTRREGAAARAAAVTVPCCLLGGDVADPFGDASGPTSQRLYTLVIRRADWPDHLPPRAGDAVRVDGHPGMRITNVQPFGGREWVCDCRSEGGNVCQQM